MATHKKAARKPGKVRAAKKPAGHSRKSGGTAELKELRTRVAALEHMLIKKEICDHDELIRTRDTAGMPRGGFSWNDQE